jgi:hypothetical protein
MEETVVTDANFLQVLLTSPLTYIVLAIIGLTIYQLKKGKSSSKCCGSNKTSTTPVAKKPVAKKPVAKKTTPKKPVAKKTATKRSYKNRKRTPKKSGK